jgi:hypothetical protein
MTRFFILFKYNFKKVKKWEVGIILPAQDKRLSFSFLTRKQQGRPVLCYFINLYKREKENLFCTIKKSQENKTKFFCPRQKTFLVVLGNILSKVPILI